MKVKVKVVRNTLYILSIGLVLALLVILPNRAEKQSHDEVLSVMPEIQMSWGLEIDSMQIDTFSIGKNQNLSDILCNAGVSSASVFQVVERAKGVFDVRKIRAGNTCYLLHHKNSVVPDYFVYHENPIDYVVFPLSDSISAYRGQKPIELRQAFVEGEIESSLWNALAAKGVSPVLAVDLSDVFAWTIDFFGIQKGDCFRVLYEEKYVDGEFVGLGKIKAAQMLHMETVLNAFWFSQNGQEGYYDEAGNSLRKAFLKAPLKYSRISSHFSNSRMHPVLKIVRPHHGVDYAAPAGTPVQSIGDGVVVKKAYQASGGGNYLTIKHNSVYTTQYMHLKGYAPGIAAGTRVKQGEVIGYVGSTGLASGPHLDFRVFKNGTPIDPLKLEAPPVEPISNMNTLVYNHVKDSLLDVLETGMVPETFPDGVMASISEE